MFCAYFVKRSWNNPGVLVCFAFCGSILIFFFFSLNRLTNVIYFDGNYFYRRGLFFGFRSSVSIDSIVEVKMFFVNRDDMYYILVDNVHITYSRLLKKSAIFLPCNEEIEMFLKSVLSCDVPHREEWQ